MGARPRIAGPRFRLVGLGAIIKCILISDSVETPSLNSNENNEHGLWNKNSRQIDENIRSSYESTRHATPEKNSNRMSKERSRKSSSSSSLSSSSSSRSGSRSGSRSVSKERNNQHCPMNQFLNPCGNLCERTCKNYHLHVPCVKICAQAACQCKNGFVRNKRGNCVKPAQC